MCQRYLFEELKKCTITFNDLQIRTMTEKRPTQKYKYANIM